MILTGFVFTLLSAPPSANAEIALHLVDVQMVWDQAPYNAFTDLIKYNGTFFLAFREGSNHYESRDGVTRVLQSSDGKNWTSAAVVSSDCDVREAHFAVRPDGVLMLNTAIYSNGNQTATAYSTNGINWTEYQRANTSPSWWVWRADGSDPQTNGNIYGVAYNPTQGIRLLSTTDGLNYGLQAALLPTQTNSDYFPNESTIHFDQTNHTGYIIVRRDGSLETTSLLGTSSAPAYTNWIWKDLGRKVESPEFIQLPDGTWLAGVRASGPVSQIAKLNVENGTLTPLLDLPSGVDTGYLGMCIDGQRLLISYYSSHEGKAKIYVAEILWEEWTPDSLNWQNTSTYRFDDGNELLDSGPAGATLTEIGTPDEVTGYNGDAFSFTATSTTGEGLYSGSCAMLNINTEGLLADFWFKAGNDQMNAYPNLATQIGVFTINLRNSDGRATFTLKNTNAVGFASVTPISSSLLDDNWHHLTAYYDPENLIMSLNIDDSYAASEEVNGLINISDSALCIGTSYQSTNSTRGLNGEIDELTIDKIYTGLKKLSAYRFDDGNELLDSGPAGATLTEIGTPDEVTGYNGDAFSFTATATTDEGLYSDSWAALNFNDNGLWVDFRFKAGNDQANDYPNLVTQIGVFTINLRNSDGRVTFTLKNTNAVGFASVTPISPSLLDNNWHHVTACYDPATTIISLDIDSSFGDSALVDGVIGASNNVLCIGNSSQSTTSHRGLNGEIDTLSIEAINPDSLLTLTMNVRSPGQSDTYPIAGQYSCQRFSVIEISANSIGTNIFDHWEGPVATPDASGTIVYMNRSKQITAIYQ